MDDEHEDAVEPTDTATEIDMLLEEVEAFKRGGAPLEAFARARVARQVLDEQLDEVGGDEKDALDADEVEELRARVDAAIARYERLAASWQRENAEREHAYLVRERSILDNERQP